MRQFHKLQLLKQAVLTVFRRVYETIREKIIYKRPRITKETLLDVDKDFRNISYPASKVYINPEIEIPVKKIPTYQFPASKRPLLLLEIDESGQMATFSYIREC